MMSIEDVLKEMREAKLDKWVAVIEQTLADKDAEIFHATRRLKLAARQREMADAEISGWLSRRMTPPCAE